MKTTALALFVAFAAVITCGFAQDDDDHSNHCHIDGFPTIHVNIGDSFELKGACLKLICKNTDLFEAVGTCPESVPNSSENVKFADSLVKSRLCTK